jgi:methyl-accepting chemotaxis protein PixJ
MLTTFRTNIQDKFNSLSFKTKAIAAAVILSLLPVLGVGSLAYVLSYNNLETAETEAQQSDVLALRSALDRFIILRGKDIQTIADLPLAKDAKVSQSLTLSAKEDFLNSYIDRYKIYDSLMFLDTSGNLGCVQR